MKNIACFICEISAVLSFSIFFFIRFIFIMLLIFFFCSQIMRFYVSSAIVLVLFHCLVVSECAQQSYIFTYIQIQSKKKQQNLSVDIEIIICRGKIIYKNYMQFLLLFIIRNMNSKFNTADELYYVFYIDFPKIVVEMQKMKQQAKKEKISKIK